MRIPNTAILSLVFALTIPSAAWAQRRTAAVKPDESGVAIALQIAGQPYRFQGSATCQYDPVAYIYSVKSEVWSVHQSNGDRYLSLTLWRPRNASGDMISLNVSSGNKTYVVNTIRTDRGNAPQGSARITVTGSGTGATFTVNATATNGAGITGTIRCGAFTATVAEGG